VSRQRCRGWLLVRLAGRLAPDEQAAAQRHLVLCTRCGPELAAERRARRAAAAGASVFATSAGLSPPQPASASVPASASPIQVFFIAVNPP